VAKTRLNQYSGRLSAERATLGMNAALRNARRLAVDARRLLDAGSPPAAASLAALSIEESGKVSILRGLVLARNDSELRESWREYRSHTKKNVAWILPDIAAKGVNNLEGFRPIFDSNSNHPQLLDSIKQLGFYTDCLGDGNWSEPAEVIENGLAQSLVATAELLSLKKPITVREVQLWIEHLGPVWKGPIDWMKKAVEHWHAAMVAEGLLEHTSTVPIGEFLWERDPTPNSTGPGV
jgi:AbiV family abortive infection protein